MSSRIVLVTGASSGIGAATTALLTARGDTVIALARSEDSLQRLASEHKAEVAVADVLDSTAIASVIAGIVARHGRLDAVVHAAQVMAYGRIEDIPEDIYNRVVDTAMHGTANIARSVLPQFRKQGNGTLVIVNSLLGQIATPKMGAYDSAKWGQLGLARVLRLEVRDVPDIHVCVVAPGAIDTPIYDQAANYAGRGGFPPPPVIGPERVAHKAVRLLDHPRRHVNAGPVNLLAIAGYRFAPAIYEAIVNPMVEAFVFRGKPTQPNAGNVLEAKPTLESAHGRWTSFGRPRRRSRRD